ncbi:MAG: hypothetical protein V7707_16840 [Motiliproteus sp.]
MATNTPFLSRRQLNFTIVICAVTIALLSIPTESWPLIQRQQLHQVEISTISEPATTSQPSAFQLRLIFALPQPSLQPQPAAQVLHRLLRTRLASAANLSARLHPDRLTVEISPTNIAAVELGPIANLLQQPFTAATIEEAIKRWRAQRYIGRHQRSTETNAVELIDQRLLQSTLNNEDNNLISPQSLDPNVTVAAINQLQRQLFQPMQLRISLIGSELDAIGSEISTLLSQLDEDQTVAGNVIGSATAVRSISTSTSTTDINAAYQTLAGRQQPDFAMTLLLSRIVQQLNPANTVRLYPGATSSQLLWLPHPPAATNLTTKPKQQTPNNWLTAAIEQSLQHLGAMKDWELDRYADQLREQLELRLEQPEAIADQLEVIAFYQLPVDYLPQFDATIAALDGAQIRQQLLQLLQQERFGQITAIQ